MTGTVGDEYFLRKTQLQLQFVEAVLLAQTRHCVRINITSGWKDQAALTTLNVRPTNRGTVPYGEKNLGKSSLRVRMQPASLLRELYVLLPVLVYRRKTRKSHNM